MAVLYRKYRSQTFGEVVGQTYIIRTLQNQVAEGSVAHAYLFTGSRGVGKTSVARILAKAVNCQNRPQGSGDACGRCEVCKQIEQGNFLDLVEIDAASNTGVDNIRELIEHVKFSPSVGRYKVFIIDEVHMLSKGAFNALLKTLEEPPKHAIFILATTEINKVPATIISRTQRFDFKRFSLEEIEERLKAVLKAEGADLAPEIVSLVAANAEGGMRDALSLLDKVLTLGKQPSLEECESLLGITDLAYCQNLLELIAAGEAAKLPALVDSLLEKGVDFSIFCRDLLEYLRKVLVYKITQGQNELFVSKSQLAVLRQQADSLSVAEIMLVIRLFLRAFKELSFAPSPQIPVLLSAVEAALRKSSAPAAGSRPAAALSQPMSAQKPAAEPSPAAPTPVAETSTEGAAANADNSATVNITLAEVGEGWPKVIQKVKHINGPLANLLKNAGLQAVSQDRIVVSVKFAFHKQNLEHTKNYSMVCKILQEVYGQPVGLRVAVAREEAPPVSPNEVLADALKVFGGELID